MKSHLDKANPAFDHELAEDSYGRIRIRATCKQCCASEVVSVVDDSLTKWEEGHECRSDKQSAQISN